MKNKKILLLTALGLFSLSSNLMLAEINVIEGLKPSTTARSNVYGLRSLESDWNGEMRNKHADTKEAQIYAKAGIANHDMVAMQYALDNGFKADTMNVFFDYTPITLAVYSYKSAGSTEMIELLLSKGIDMEEPRNYEAMKFAAKEGYRDVIILLNSYGMPVKGLDNDDLNHHASSKTNVGKIANEHNHQDIVDWYIHNYGNDVVVTPPVRHNADSDRHHTSSDHSTSTTYTDQAMIADEDMLGWL